MVWGPSVVTYEKDRLALAGALEPKERRAVAAAADEEQEHDAAEAKKRRKGARLAADTSEAKMHRKVIMQTPVAVITQELGTAETTQQGKDSNPAAAVAVEIELDRVKFKKRRKAAKWAAQEAS